MFKAVTVCLTRSTPSEPCQPWPFSPLSVHLCDTLNSITFPNPAHCQKTNPESGQVSPAERTCLGNCAVLGCCTTSRWKSPRSTSSSLRSAPVSVGTWALSCKFQPYSAHLNEFRVLTHGPVSVPTSVPQHLPEAMSTVSVALLAACSMPLALSIGLYLHCGFKPFPSQHPDEVTDSGCCLPSRPLMVCLGSRSTDRT